MKKIPILLVAFIAIVSCTKENSKAYLSFSGILENNTDSLITIALQQRPIKTITIKLFQIPKSKIVCNFWRHRTRFRLCPSNIVCNEHVFIRSFDTSAHVSPRTLI